MNMVEKNYFSIQEAAIKMGKSVQTLRRLIKKGEIATKKIKTPQGFSYLIEIASEKETFSNSHIQNVSLPLQLEEKSSAPIQPEELTSQNPIEPQQDHDFYHLDLQKPEILSNHTLKKLLGESHKEKIFLMTIIERLQNELSQKKSWDFIKIFRR